MKGLSGSLTFATVEPLLRNGLAREIERLESDLVDLGSVDRIDTAGAALLLEIARRARTKGRSLTMINANPQVSSLLEFLRLSGTLGLNPSLATSPRESA